MNGTARTSRRVTLKGVKIDALADDTAWICKEADAIALLPGWENSKGAKAELALAEALGHAVIHVADPLAVETFGPLESYVADVKAELADEAKAIVTGARRSAYGTPEMNFERIARFWHMYFLNTNRTVKIRAADVSPMMRLMKEARLCETPDHRDSFVDLIGYALTGAEVNGLKPKGS
jgi:hypothetical protein